MDFPFLREALASLFKKSSCAMYPARPAPAAPGYRGRIVFHADKCINCMMCERVCSGNAITHSVEKTEAGEKITRSFYLGSCTFCATCMDFCTHGAIEFTEDYHMIATREEDLIVSGSFIKKSPVKKAPPAPTAEKQPEAPDPGETACQAPEPAEPKNEAPSGRPVQDPDKCVYCALCAKNCPAGAIEVDRAAKSWKLDAENCVGCGSCVSSCPKQCLHI